MFGVVGFFVSGLWAWIRKLQRRRQVAEGLLSEEDEEEILPPEAYVATEDVKAQTMPKGPAMVILQRVIPMLLLIGMVVVAFVVFSGKDAITPQKFADTLQSMGYATVDSTEKLQQEWKVGSMLEQATSLDTGDIRIDFCVMDTLTSARSLYHGMTLPVAEGTEVENSGQNHENYSIENDQLYAAKLRVGSTVVYAACLPANRAEVMEILQEIGYLEE